MFFISCGPCSRVGARAHRILFDETGARSAAAGKTVRSFAVALTAATLAACAQSSVVTDRSAPSIASRQAPTQTRVSFNRQAAVARTKHAARRTVKRATAAANRSYGVASFYEHDTQTASGEKFNPNELTAAHPTLPFGTRLRVTDVTTGRSVTVRVNDRGPYIPGRIVDVSSAAAETLGITERGVTKVKLDVVQ
jgi:peptidoglycan lytic transglycosylase